MRDHKFRLLLLAASTLGAAAPACAADFAKDVQPILESYCYACHGAKLQMGGLRLDSKKLALAGGKSGAIIEPGKSTDSLLYRRVAGIGDLPRMPMGGKPLEAAQLALIRNWIDQGAAWPDGAAESKQHWAFIPPKRPTLPKVAGATWAANPIDRFILARLEKEGLAPSPEADRVTLLRRLSLDLIGLPPTIEEVDAFLADKSKNAYNKQVDRLLASPHYGERWGRIRLGAAPYADSNGLEEVNPPPA